MSSVQIFNNAAFDSGGGLELERSEIDMKCLSGSIESDSSKENHNPFTTDSPAPFKTPVLNNLIQPSGVIDQKTAFSGKGMVKDTIRDEAMIDAEMKQIEMEMSRLSSKLEALKVEKAEMKKARVKERRCSIVPAKYMDPITKHSASSKTVLQRRGVSLGPAEIYSAAKSRQCATKVEVSSTNAQQNRRQSCFWKLGEIDELKVTKAQGRVVKSASVSPKPPLRSALPKYDALKKGNATTGAKKMMPKNGTVLSTVQPRKLFKEGESERSSASAGLKKPMKSGRVIPSRYNQNPTQTPETVSAAKVRSLFDSESRVKKRWEIPAKGEVVVYMSNDIEESRSMVEGVDEMGGDVLRKKIRTVRCVNESPRDSGAVKRVADLVGKKSFFADSGQALSFVDEEAGDEENDAWS